MVRRRVCNTCGRLSPTKKYLGTDILVWFKVCLKDATDVEFLCSSLRLFQSLFFFIVTPIVGVCYCSMFCCTLLYNHSSFAIILMGKGELVALLSLSSWCLVMIEWLFLVVPRICLQFVLCGIS